MHDSDRDDIIPRLENWGRVVRSYPARAPSMTAIACLALKRERWKADLEPRVFESREAHISPDERDGWLIEWVWVQLPDRQKWLLKALYVLRLHRNRACWKLGIWQKNFESERRKAELMVRNRLFY